MGNPITKNFMEPGGEKWVINGELALSEDGALTIEAGATITGLTGATTFASDAEAITGTNTTKVLSPKNLAAAAAAHVPAATDSVAGKVELATDAEALAGEDTGKAVTPHALVGAIGKVEVISFTGKDGVGACDAVGLNENDIVLSITGIATGSLGDQSGKFESVVSVDDEIQQSDAGDLSDNIYLALVLRQS